jgi:hypothetical protein
MLLIEVIALLATSTMGIGIVYLLYKNNSKPNPYLRNRGDWYKEKDPFPYYCSLVWYMLVGFSIFAVPWFLFFHPMW